MAQLELDNPSDGRYKKSHRTVAHTLSPGLAVALNRIAEHWALRYPGPIAKGVMDLHSALYYAAPENIAVEVYMLRGSFAPWH